MWLPANYIRRSVRRAREDSWFAAGGTVGSHGVRLRAIFIPDPRLCRRGISSEVWAIRAWAYIFYFGFIRVCVIWRVCWYLFIYLYFVSQKERGPGVLPAATAMWCPCMCAQNRVTHHCRSIKIDGDCGAWLGGSGMSIARNR